MSHSRIFTPEGLPELNSQYLLETEFMDFSAPSVRGFCERAKGDASDPVQVAVNLFYAVRDRLRYDPYAVRLDRESYRASTVAMQEGSYCIPKAVLLCACARAEGIPSAIGLSDVRNHLTSDKLSARMAGKTLFLHHGYALLWLEGRWVQAAPAFNASMCERFSVLATEFDGRSDAKLQEFDASSRRHMEYVREHGVWSDLPYERIAMDFQDYYPPSFYSGVEEDDALFA